MRTPNGNAVTALLALLLVTLQGCTPELPKPVDAPPPDVTVQKPVSKNVQESYEYVGRTESPDFVEILRQGDWLSHEDLLR